GLDGVTMFEVESAEVQTEVLQDRNGDGIINAADAWLGRNGQDVATTLKGAARRALLGEAGESVTFLHKDHLGSTIAATGEDGAVLERISYYPYGLVRSSTAVETERASFIGNDFDAVTGFVHFGLRDLSPRDGRW